MAVTGPKILIRGFGNNAPASTPPAAWTPASLTGVQEWWYTGAGLVQTSNEAQSWTGQVNSTVLTKNTGTGLTYTAADSDVNNKPTIAQNASRNLATLQNANITSFTPTVQRYVGVIGFAKTTSTSNYRIIGVETSTGGTSSEIAPFVSSPTNPNKAGAYFFSGGQKTFGITTDDTLFYIVVQINTGGTSGDGYYNSTTSGNSFTGVSVADLDPYNIEAGGYQNGAGGFNWDGKIMEMFVGNGAMTSEDFSSLDSYVTDTYS